MTKKCSTCKETKPESEYYHNKNNADGHMGACKLCHNLGVLEWQRAHPERVAEYAKPGNAKRAQWCKENAEEHARICRAWKAKNPEKNKEYRQKCAAKKKLLKQAAVLP